MAEFLRPDADGAIGNWTGEDGRTTNLFTSVNESTFNLATYIQSGINPSNDKVRLRYSDPVGLITSGKVRYTYGKKNNNSTVVNQRTQLVQGASTIIAYWDHADIPYTPATVAQDLTGPQLASITDFNDLWIEHIANPSTWAPGDIGTDLLAFFTPKDLTKLYQTDDTSTPVTADTQDVGRIVSQNNALYVNQGTQANRPTYRANGLGTGSPSIRYDGSNDYLWTGFSNAIAVSPQDKLFFATVLKYDSTNTAHLDTLLGFVDYSIGEMYAGAHSAAAILHSNTLGGGSSLGLQAYRNNTTLSYIIVASGTRIAIISKFDATNHTLIADGTAQTPVASTGNFGSSGDLIVGCGVQGGSPTRFAQCDIGPIIFGKNLTSGNETSLISWLAAY